MTYWKERFDKLKKENDKALIELFELTKKYNSLLDKYKALLSTSESNE